MSPQALAALPHALLAEFRNAVVLLDRERITRIIGRIWERDSELGSALARSAALLEYSAIFEAIEDCQSKLAGPASLTGGKGQPSRRWGRIRAGAQSAWRLGPRTSRA